MGTLEVAEIIGKRVNSVGIDILDAWDHYDARHPRPNAVDNTITGVLSSISVASEVAALKVGERPSTIPNTIARVSLHGLAIGSAFAAGVSFAQAERK